MATIDTEAPQILEDEWEPITVHMVFPTQDMRNVRLNQWHTFKKNCFHEYAWQASEYHNLTYTCQGFHSLKEHLWLDEYGHYLGLKAYFNVDTLEEPVLALRYILSPIVEDVEQQTAGLDDNSLLSWYNFP